MVIAARAIHFSLVLGSEAAEVWALWEGVWIVGFMVAICTSYF
jgi:hypothetical protein